MTAKTLKELIVILQKLEVENPDAVLDHEVLVNDVPAGCYSGTDKPVIELALINQI